MIDRIYTLHSPTTIEPYNQLMTLGENLHIHPDILIGQGLFCSGIPGMGKTSILARILEQVAPFQIPLVCFDLEGDLQSTVSYMPRGVIGTALNCPSAQDVLNQGLQVCYDLSSWGTMEERGSFVARMINSLFTVSEALPPSQRVPCLIAVDEASIFAPQVRGSMFSADLYKALLEAFHAIAVRGRKFGLTPLLFTQKIGEIAKTALAPGNFIILKQTVHSDLKRCLDYVEKSGVFHYMTEKQIMGYIASLTPGQAIVKLSNGEQKIVQFYERDSVHLSVTPTTQIALARYGNLPFNPGASFGPDVDDDEDLPSAATVDFDAKLSGVKRVRQLLESNPGMRVCELARMAKVEPSTASRTRAKFFESRN
jgi:hypothetical protein